MHLQPKHAGVCGRMETGRMLRLYTLYALDKKKEITNPQTLLDDLALRGNLKNACRSADFAEDDADF